MRIHNPSTPILFNKTDLDAAYRRLHVAIKYALLCITIIGRIAYLLVRLPFGSTPAADEFCTISESITDLAQSIAEDKTWDPSTLKSDQSIHIPDPAINNKEIFLEEHPIPLWVPVPYKPIYMDDYIDDIITITLLISSLIEKAKQAVPLSIHTVFRSIATNEPIPRDPTISIRKLQGEGQLSERKEILGWIVDSNQFKIFLPEHKCTA